MNGLNKVLIIACSIFSVVGIVVIINNFRLNSLDVPSSRVLDIIALLFWYVQPILGLFMFFVSRDRRPKYLGALFFLLSLFAWLTYIFRP